MAKKSSKSSASSATDATGDLGPYNIWSNGRDTPKATTLGNQLRRFMPQISSKPIIVDAR
jgi:hypothetical protein